MYEYYLCLRIVMLKRRKAKSCNDRFCGKRGSSAAGLAGSQIKKKLKGWKEQMVYEYRQVTGRTEPGSASDADLTDQAMRHLHALILQDLRPP
jgi:hypothetical protein